MKNTRFFVFIFFIALAVVVGGVAGAASKSWNGNDAAHLASNAGNWDGGVLPASGDALTLPAGKTIIWDLAGVVPLLVATSAKTSLQTPLSIAGNLEIKNDIFDLNAQPLNIGGSLIVSGGTLNAGASPISVSGSWALTGGSVQLASNAVTFTGGGNRTILSGGQHFGALSLNATGGTTALSDDFFVDSGLVVADGLLALGNRILTASGGITVASGTLSVDNGTIVLSGSMGRPFVFSGGTFTAGSASTVEYRPVSGSVTVEPATYGNLKLAGNAMFSLSGDTTVNGVLTVDAGATLSPSGRVLNVPNGRLDNNGTIMDGAIRCPSLSLAVKNASGNDIISLKDLSGNIYVRVEDRDLNRKGAIIENANGLTITTMSGDKELVRMVENGAATGVFSTDGAIVHQGTTTQGNGQIEVGQNDIIFIDYTDPQDPNDKRSAQVSVALSGIISSGAPQIVTGSRVVNLSGQNTGAGTVYSAHIVWDTDKVSTSSVSVSSVQLTAPITAGSLTGTTSHDVVVTGLKRGAAYSFTASSVTADGKSVVSKARQFVVIVNGDRIKTASSPAVYWHLNDKRNVFSDATVYDSWFSDFAGVVTVPSDQMSDLPLGKNVPVRGGTYLIKIQSDPKTYAVEPLGRLRWIQTETQAIALYGSNWSKRVRDVDVAQFVSYAVGEPLAANDFPSAYVYQVAGGEWFVVSGRTARQLTETGKSSNGLSGRFVGSVAPKAVESLSSASAYSGYAPDIDGVFMDGTTAVVAPAFIN